MEQVAQRERRDLGLLRQHRHVLHDRDTKVWKVKLLPLNVSAYRLTFGTPDVDMRGSAQRAGFQFRSLVNARRCYRARASSAFPNPLRLGNIISVRRKHQGKGRLNSLRRPRPSALVCVTVFLGIEISTLLVALGGGGFGVVRLKAARMRSMHPPTQRLHIASRPANR